MGKVVQIDVGELRPSDIGSRVVVIDQAGNAFDGVLDSFWAMRWQHRDHKVLTDVTVTAGGSALKLGDLPNDYRLQIEREVQS